MSFPGFGLQKELCAVAPVLARVVNRRAIPIMCSFRRRASEEMS